LWLQIIAGELSSNFPGTAKTRLGSDIATNKQWVMCAKQIAANHLAV